MGGGVVGPCRHAASTHLPPPVEIPCGNGGGCSELEPTPRVVVDVEDVLDERLGDCGRGEEGRGASQVMLGSILATAAFPQHALAGLAAYRLRSRRSTLMNGPPPVPAIIDAVPRRTWRPSAVMGRDVPGRTPRKAWSTDSAPVVGRALVPGRAKPVTGRPLCVMGRIAPSRPPPPPGRVVMGRDSDVPAPGSHCS